MRSRLVRTEKDLKHYLKNLHGRNLSKASGKYNGRFRCRRASGTGRWLANSATSRLAPPTRAPSTLGSRMNPAMLPDFTDPPYRMRVACRDLFSEQAQRVVSRSFAAHLFRLLRALPPGRKPIAQTGS